MPFVPWPTGIPRQPISGPHCGSWVQSTRHQLSIGTSVFIPTRSITTLPYNYVCSSASSSLSGIETCTFSPSHHLPFPPPSPISMSRSRFPPTPAMSGELIIKDQPVDSSDAFALPPAAMSPAKMDSASRRSSRSDPTYVPASPTSPELVARGRSTQHARSGTATKRPLEDFDLPPPPTRTRKIIQMKPKSPATARSPAKPKDSAKGAAQTASEASNANANASAGASSKKKQPSATSAAGRKIARKTAHSLIERRRRSKMNEEFGTLKDMIPACRGQEMHKLAILQVCSSYNIVSLPRENPNLTISPGQHRLRQLSRKMHPGPQDGRQSPPHCCTSISHLPRIHCRDWHRYCHAPSTPTSSLFHILLLRLLCCLPRDPAPQHSHLRRIAVIFSPHKDAFCTYSPRGSFHPTQSCPRSQ